MIPKSGRLYSTLYGFMAGVCIEIEINEVLCSFLATLNFFSLRYIDFYKEIVKFVVVELILRIKNMIEGCEQSKKNLKLGFCSR